MLFTSPKPSADKRHGVEVLGTIRRRAGRVSSRPCRRESTQDAIWRSFSLPEVVRPSGRMAVFLDLGGQGTAAAAIVVGVEHLPGAVDHRLAEAVPISIAGLRSGVAVVEQLAVLDEEQALAHQPRHLVEAAEYLLGEADAVDRHPAATGQAQPGGGLFRVGRRTGRGRPAPPFFGEMFAWEPTE